MTQKITGTLSADARVIVFDETEGSIEYNTEHVAGDFEASDLSDGGNKIVIARTSSGESFGYGNINPEYYSGVPSGDDFSEGLDNWILSREDSDCSMDWYESNSLRLSINTGGSTEADWVKAMWIYQLDGDWDIQINYERISGSGVSYMYSLKVTADNNPDCNDDFVAVRWRSNQSEMQSFYRMGGTNYSVTDNSIGPSYSTPNLKFRITKVGSIFTTYHDPGTGSWQQVAQFDIPAWENSRFNPSPAAYRYGSSNVSCKFTNFIVNSGTVVEPVVDTVFDYDTVGTNYQIDDTFGDWTVTQKGANDFIEVVESGLRVGNSTNDGALFVESSRTFSASEDFTIIMDFTKNSTQVTEGGWWGLLLDNNTSSTDERIAMVYSPTPSAGVRIFKYVNGSQTNSIATGLGDDGTIIIDYTESNQTFNFFHKGISITSLTQNFGSGPIYQRFYSDNWSPGTPILDFTINRYIVL